MIHHGTMFAVFRAKIIIHTYSTHEENQLTSFKSIKIKYLNTFWVHTLLDVIGYKSLVTLMTIGYLEREIPKCDVW